jgi:hypothetical protein
MTVLKCTLLTEATVRNASGFGLRRRIASFAERMAHWIEATAGRYAAAAIYDQLSRLSDAERQRRGLSRETLANDL